MYSAVKDTIFSPDFSLNFKGNLRVYKQPIVMGIINSTPDSFYLESRVDSTKNLLSRVEQMINEGVEIIDIGGYSSRPGAAHISINEEIDRVSSLIQNVKSEFPDCLISIDTFRAEVAEIAISAGADMINDISGGQADIEMFNIAAKNSVPICLMHLKGTPQNMHLSTDYNNLISDLLSYFSTQIKLAKQAGIKDIIIDPGFGFSKTLDQNYQLVNMLEQFKLFNLPILIGVSRKSMLYKLLESTPQEALNATTALHMLTLMKGAKLLRVHDVKAAYETIQIFSKSNSY